MTTFTCDQCGRTIQPKAGFRATRYGSGFTFIPRVNIVRHAAEENESHVCSGKCAGELLEGRDPGTRKSKGEK